MTARRNKGFTLLELLVVIAIIGVLAAVVLVSSSTARESAQHARALAEFREMEQALELYRLDHGVYPPDENRGLPSGGVEDYLSTGSWPEAPWPGSVYDWDVWSVGGEDIIQISIRFCPAGGGISSCNFPEAEWAEDFDTNSAAYYCIEGPCRSHEGEPEDHPGYCVNC